MNVETLIDELKERLQLEAEARSDAINGLPESHATAPMPAEIIAVAAAEEVAKSEIEVAQKSGTEAGNALNSCEATLVAARQACQDIEGEMPPVPRNVDTLIQECDSAKASYAAFKASHKLERNATGDDRVLQGVWATVVVVLESMVNSYFYMPISDLGLIGGFFTAFFVSLVNVGCAFFGGVLGVRYLTHIEPTKKLGGLIALLFFTCACALVIALSALFRGHADAMSAKELDTIALMDGAWQAAVKSLIELDVLDLLASLHSFLLTLVGLLCAVIGFWKGWAFDDPYPGFGAAYRRKERRTVAKRRRRKLMMKLAKTKAIVSAGGRRVTSRSCATKAPSFLSREQGWKQLVRVSARRSMVPGTWPQIPPLWRGHCSLFIDSVTAK